MVDTHHFVAAKLWLLVAIVTLPLASLAAIANAGLLAAAITVVGWFLLTPVLLFFGHEIADVVVAGDGDGEAEGEGEPSDAADAADAEDPVETLKERYARGEIDDAEFERALERLVALDGVAVDGATRDVLLGPDDGSDAPGDGPNSGGRDGAAPNDDPAGERELERE